MVSQKPWSLEAAARMFIYVMATLFAGMVFAGMVEGIKSWSREERDFAEMGLMAIFFQCSVLFWITRLLLKSPTASSTETHRVFDLLRTARRKMLEIVRILLDVVRILSAPKLLARLFCKVRLRARATFFSGARDWRAIGIGLGAGILASGPLVLLQGWISDLAEKVFHRHLDAQEVVEKLSSPTISLAAKIFLGFTAIALAPMAEEALFRGVLYPTIKQMGYRRTALLGTSILFGLSHASLMAFVPLTLFAMLLVWLYELTDNLMAPMMAHCALNTVNFFWIIYSGSTGP